MVYDGLVKWNVRSFMYIVFNFVVEGYGLGGFKFDLVVEMFVFLCVVDCGV